MPRALKSLAPLAICASLLGGTFLVSQFTACDFGTGSTSSLDDTDRVLQDVSSKVIYATYSDLSAKAAALQDALKQLAQTPNASTLSAARQAWKNTRVPWESNESFLFGPVETINVDPAIDSWPLNQVDLDKVLNGGEPLTQAFVDSLGFNLKGFHTLEYLLFGDTAADSAQYAAKLTPRRLAYMQACAASLADEVNALLQAWSPSGGNFIGTFQDAGPDNAVYPTRRQALQEILNGMFNICDEVANEKIYRPLVPNPPDRSQEESQWSDNSATDFANNMRSVRNVYRGGYGADSGFGMRALLQKSDPALAAQVQAEIDSAINVTAAIGSFDNAMFHDRGKIDAASTAIRTLRATLLLRVAPALGLN